MRTLLLISLLLISGCAATQSQKPSEQETPRKPEKAEAHVIGHHCDGGQGVDGLAIIVTKAGPLTLTWNNENVCGRPS